MRRRWSAVTEVTLSANWLRVNRVSNAIKINPCIEGCETRHEYGTMHEYTSMNYQWNGNSTVARTPAFIYCTAEASSVKVTLESIAANSSKQKKKNPEESAEKAEGLEIRRWTAIKEARLFQETVSIVTHLCLLIN